MVRLRAFGTYEFRVKEYAKFLKEVVGTDGHFTTEEIEERLASLITATLADILGENNKSILDLAADYDTFAEYIQESLKDEFSKYGLELTQIIVENISLPKEVEEAIDSRSSREIAGDLNEHLKYEGAEALKNNSAASEISSIATGMVMAQELNKTFNNSSNTQNTPPPLPNEAKYFIVKNQKAAGPYTKEEIERMIRNKELHANSFIWRDGLSDWIKIKDSELKNLLPIVPPKVPNGEND